MNDVKEDITHLAVEPPEKAKSSLPPLWRVGLLMAVFVIGLVLINYFAMGLWHNLNLALWMVGLWSIAWVITIALWSAEKPS